MTDLLSLQLATEKIAIHVIKIYPKTMALAFGNSKQEKELLIIDDLSKESTYPMAKINTNNMVTINTNYLNGVSFTILNPTTLYSADYIFGDPNPTFLGSMVEKIILQKIVQNQKN